MFNAKINFDEITEQRFGKLKEGKYIVVVSNIQKCVWATPVIGGKSEKLDITHETSLETPETFMEFTFQVIDGESTGINQYDNLYLWADNEIRRRISRALFKKICVAIGLDPNLCQVSEFIGKPLQITLKTSKDGKYINVNNAEKYSQREAFVSPPVDSDIPF